jgi:hypothetical protein
MKKALGILEKLTGEGFMTQLFDFAAALFEVQVNFKANLQKISHLLESPQVGFMMVSAATPDTAPEVHHFIDNLKQHRFHFDGIILNRTLTHLTLKDPPPGFEAAFDVLRSHKKREDQVLQNLMRNPFPVCAKLPELARDVHSVEDLFHVAMAFGASDSSLNPELVHP